jgi:hypothetical protein
MREWRNWQTRWLQVPVLARAWGFKSPLAHRGKNRLSRKGQPVFSCLGVFVSAVLGRRSRVRGRAPIAAGKGNRRQRQEAALRTSSSIFFTSASARSVIANDVGHMVPSSRFAGSLKPSVAYRASNLAAAWKKHTTLPSRA